MDEPNKVLAGRYELGDTIGRGGMAEVHIGHDRRLGRTVAIKVLRSDLARDPSFQNRFRREAQAAASLNHPTIVSVYDTGEELVTEPTGAVSHVPFIVMEYVEGHTVRDNLRSGTPMPVDEAVEITCGVLSALEYSHQAGIVHRDIKPANVMMTPTGAVKVMDFGIARAVADSAATMTQSQAVIGTAQYLSPEQARGEQVDARSDLYSTGCLLFELVTGRPPFVADSPVAVAYQHVRENPPLPSALAPGVPEALDRIVHKALAKDREDRYQTAAEFRADLEALQRGGRVLAPPVGATVPAIATTQVITPTATNTTVMPPAHLPWGATGAEEASAAAARAAAAEEPKPRRALVFTLVAIGLVAAVGVVWLLLSQGASAATVAVPKVAGMAESDAVTVLKNDGFTPKRAEEASTTVASGTVTRTSPTAGTQAAKSSTVTYFVSTGPASTVVPDVSGRSPQDATDILTKAGFTVSADQKSDDNPDFVQGLVTKTNPAANAAATEGQQITLYVSTGRVVLTDVTGMTQADAVKELQRLKMAPVVTTQESSTIAVGKVISMNPGAGSLQAQNTSVTIVVAAPPSTGVIPAGLAGLTATDAAKRLSDAGFTNVTQAPAASDVPVGSVVSVNPASGQTVPLSQQVTLTVSTGPGATASPTKPAGTPTP